VAAAGLKIAMSIFTACMGGAEAPSETQLMEDRLNQRLDEIADQISEVQEQLAEISDHINESTEKIIASVSTSVENESDKNHLRDFMLSSGQGDFSYNQLRNYIYGIAENNSNGMTAYYALLQEAQLNGGSSEEIKHYYDLLYSSLVDNRTSFHHYITGDGNVKRFRMIDDRESFWVDFAEDWNPNVSKQDLIALGYTKVSIKLDFHLNELTQGNFRAYFATPGGTEMFRWSFTDNPSGWTTYNKDSAKDGTYIDISVFGDNMEFKTIWEAYGNGGDAYDIGETTITLTFHK